MAESDRKHQSGRVSGLPHWTEQPGIAIISTLQRLQLPFPPVITGTTEVYIMTQATIVSRTGGQSNLLSYVSIPLDSASSQLGECSYKQHDSPELPLAWLASCPMKVDGDVMGQHGLFVTLSSPTNSCISPRLFLLVP